jgi:hypothetical protein
MHHVRYCITLERTRGEAVTVRRYIRVLVSAFGGTKRPVVEASCKEKPTTTQKKMAIDGEVDEVRGKEKLEMGGSSEREEKAPRGEEKTYIYAVYNGLTAPEDERGEE